MSTETENERLTRKQLEHLSRPTIRECMAQVGEKFCDQPAEYRVLTTDGLRVGYVCFQHFSAAMDNGFKTEKINRT